MLNAWNERLEGGMTMDFGVRGASDQRARHHQKLCGGRFSVEPDSDLVASFPGMTGACHRVDGQPSEGIV
jgi:hypothetical protein